MRGRINAAKSYAANVEIDEIMVGSVIAQVVESKHPNVEVGDIVNAGIGWQEYGTAAGDHLRKIDPTIAPISTGGGILGMPGLTAYFGLLEVGKLQERGDGYLSLVPLAQCRFRCRTDRKNQGVVGLSVPPEPMKKVAYIVDELGFDDAFNYKEVTDYHEELQRLLPDGIDVYFDNVGGTITDAVFLNLRIKGRVVICGQISQYKFREAGNRTPFPLAHDH